MFKLGFCDSNSATPGRLVEEQSVMNLKILAIFLRKNQLLLLLKKKNLKLILPIVTFIYNETVVHV